MTYNFDEIIDRRHTNALNTDGFRGYIFHAGPEKVFAFKDEEFVRMWVADMEFGVAPEILDALRARDSKDVRGGCGGRRPCGRGGDHARRHGAGGLSRPPGGGDGARTRAPVRHDPRGTQPPGAPSVRARGAARPAARARGGGGAATRHARAASVAAADGCGGRLPEIAPVRRKILCKFSAGKLQNRLAKWLEFA